MTGYYFTHRKEIITQNYPDQRESMVLPERFRGEVVMPHDDKNEHACTGCTACELACPNGTIKIITKFDITPEGFAAMTRVVVDLANELCRGRIVSVLEGGYRLDGLSDSVVAHVRALQR